MTYASVEDVAARLGRPVLDAESPRVTALIEDVSAFIEDYCTGVWDRTTPPSIFKAVACSEVMRWMVVTPGVVAERAGELETQFGDTASVLGLSQAAKDALRRYRLKAASITVQRDRPEFPCVTTPNG